MYSLWQDLSHGTIMFDHNLWPWPWILKILNLGCYLVMVAAWQASSSYKFYWPVCLSFCVSVANNFNLGHNFWTTRDRYFIFQWKAFTCVICILNQWNPFKWHHGQWPWDLYRHLYSKNSHFWLCCNWRQSCFTNTSFFYFSDLKPVGGMVFQ